MPLLSATFTFDDHIRCMAAKQRLTKGRIKARQRKMHQIAKLLELPGSVGPSCPSPPTNNLSSMRDSRKLHSDLECVQSRFLVQKLNSNKIQKSVVCLHITAVCLHFLLFCLHFNFLFDLCQLFVDKAICTSHSSKTPFLVKKYFENDFIVLENGKDKYFQNVRSVY